jgi:GNAT superfamily N-acetyltransferase
MPLTPTDLPEVLQALSSWQVDGAPVQLHPGDLGWAYRLGTGAVADAVRIWRSGDTLTAVGFLDGPGLMRMGIAPGCDGDDELAARIVDDLSSEGGPHTVEARAGTALRTALDGRGWTAGEAWTPLHRSGPTTAPPPTCSIEIVDATTAPEWLEVVRSAFGTPAPPPERWALLADSPMITDGLGRLLLGRDHAGDAVAAIGVWSAGPGRPGLIEPMGVAATHRGRGHGRAITLAGVAELAALGASGAVIATPTDNTAAVTTYVAAGFTAGEPVTDFRRPA